MSIVTINESNELNNNKDILDNWIEYGKHYRRQSSY